MPERIQLRRSKGWRLPAGARSVARPSRYGNPIRMDDDREAAAVWFAVGLDMRRAGTLPPGHSLHSYPSDEEIRRDLAGRDLGCYCEVGLCCHGDTLLEVANGWEL